jgi:hypothetical protein
VLPLISLRRVEIVTVAGCADVSWCGAPERPARYCARMSEKKTGTLVAESAVELGLKVGGGALAGAAIAGAGGAAGGALVGASGALIKDGPTAALGFVARLRERRMVAWWERTRRLFIGDELQEKIRDKPGAHAAILESVRRVEMAVTEDVVPILGDLVSDHLIGEEPMSDAFFRGFSRLLADLDSSELKALTKLMAALAPINAAVLNVFHDLSGDALCFPMDPAEDLESEIALGKVAHARRLFHLMVLHGLAIDPATYEHRQSRTVPLELYAERATVQRMLRYLAPPY